MDQVTWTVEEIELQASEYEKSGKFAARFGATGVAVERKRDAAMLRAFAAQTRQVEMMREWLENQANKAVADNGVSMLSEMACKTIHQFNELFPKDGAQ